MRYQELEKLTKQSSLDEITEFVWERFEDDPRLPTLTMHYRSFRMTQSFLIEIWGRILNDLRLDNAYWSIQAEIHDSEQEQEIYQPTEEEMKTIGEYRSHENRLNLDVEDWFLHAHILMEKYVRLFKQIVVQTANDKDSRGSALSLANRSFDRHVKEVMNSKKVRDEGYRAIIAANKPWYYDDLKDVRDDLIQHEQIGRFWGTYISVDQFTISRFMRTDKMVRHLTLLREKYKGRIPALQAKPSVLDWFEILEANTGEVDSADLNALKQVRKEYGRQFPDIPLLYSKMNAFFASVNDHLLKKLQGPRPRALGSSFRKPGTFSAVTRSSSP